ncbi:MAG: pyrroline-5-carboxylate reductase dimerization domain-containing protein [Pseudomonadota bacterium]
MRLGIIGVGHLAVSILRGLTSAGWNAEDILLSPRGQAQKQARHNGFEIADSNADLVHRSDLVLLAVRPADARNAISDLPWRSGQVLMSACAGVPLAVLSEAAGAAAISRIMPITASELGASPTLAYPMRPEIEPFLTAIGSIIPLTNEDQFETATVSAALFGWAQALIRHAADWSTDHGLDEHAARQLVARTFVASGRMIAEKDASMADILDSLCTPGGITEAGLIHLNMEGVPDGWRGACDLVLEKLKRR